MKVFELRRGTPRGPQIDYQNHVSDKDLQLVSEVLSGERDISDYPKSITVRTESPESDKVADWDFLNNPSMPKLYSKRLLDLFGASILQGLTPLPISVNGCQFFHLRVDQVMDWIDFDQSDVARTKTGIIIDIDNLVFHKEAMPIESVFVNRHYGDGLFLTETVARRLDDAMGIRLIPLCEGGELEPPVDVAPSYYVNDAVGVSISTPFPWKLSSWQSVKRIDGKYFQTHNEDLPESDGGMKFLFTARLYKKNSDAMLDADIELSVMRHPEGFNLAASMAENFEKTKGMYQRNGIDTQRVGSGDWEVSGVTFAYVDKVNTSGTETRGSAKKKSQYRFVFRKISPTLWLYAKIAGHKESAYQHALEVFGSLQCSDGA